MCAGKPVQGGIPLAFDVTLVSPLSTAGEARPRAAVVLGVAIEEVEADNERRCPELVHFTLCLLLVLAGEVGGRWSETTVRFTEALAKHRSKTAPGRLRKFTQLGWEHRWWGC